MKAEQLIKEVREHCEEYLELVQDPSLFIAGVIAHKYVELNSRLEYLDKRIVALEKSAYGTERH